MSSLVKPIVSRARTQQRTTCRPNAGLSTRGIEPPAGRRSWRRGLRDLDPTALRPREPSQAEQLHAGRPIAGVFGWSPTTAGDRRGVRAAVEIAPTENSTDSADSARKPPTRPPGRHVSDHQDVMSATTRAGEDQALEVCAICPVVTPCRFWGDRSEASAHLGRRRRRETPARRRARRRGDSGAADGDSGGAVTA